MNPELGVSNIPPYAYVLLAFSIWMLIDAVRRRAASYWYFVILFLPFGAVFYFYFVKLRDFTGNRGSPNAASGSLPPQTPEGPSTAADSGIPNLDRADKFEESERFSEAEPLYRRALELDGSNCQALHGLGRCLIGQDQAKEALPHFEKLLELDREYRNFGAALDYADALWEAGQKSDTIEVLEQLSKLTGRINHRLALGHYLAEFGQIERARQEITRAIDEANLSDAVGQGRSRQWVERGREMLQALPTSESRP